MTCEQQFVSWNRKERVGNERAGVVTSTLDQCSGVSFFFFFFQEDNTPGAHAQTHATMNSTQTDISKKKKTVT